MNKLKSLLIILLLILLTFSFLVLPEYLFEKSSLRLLETTENLTYNYESESISPSQLAEIFCSGELESTYIFMTKEEIIEYSEASVREKTDSLLKSLFKSAHNELYTVFSDIASGEIMDYSEKNIFIQETLKKPVALNFISISFVKENAHFSLFFEEKTQTVFSMEYVPYTGNPENYNGAYETAYLLNGFFYDYFANVLNVNYYNVYTTIEKESIIYCSNYLFQASYQEN